VFLFVDFILSVFLKFVSYFVYFDFIFFKLFFGFVLFLAPPPSRPVPPQGAGSNPGGGRASPAVSKHAEDDPEKMLGKKRNFFSIVGFLLCFCFYVYVLLCFLIEQTHPQTSTHVFFFFFLIFCFFLLADLCNTSDPEQLYSDLKLIGEG
jgi:hypothetical protein